VAMGCGAGTHSPSKPRDKGPVTKGTRSPSAPHEYGPITITNADSATPVAASERKKPAPLRELTQASGDSAYVSPVKSKISQVVKKEELFRAMSSNQNSLEKSEVKPEVLTAEARRLLFEILDWNRSSTLYADELMRMLLRLQNTGLEEEDVTASIREIDSDGDGGVCLEDFISLLNSPPPPDETVQPHLVLHFDVNQTILMADSLTAGDASILLNCVLANAAWGRIVEDPEKKSADGSHTPGEVPPWQHWELVSEVPEIEAPGPDLKTYCQFLSQWIPAGKCRRKLLRAFTSPGSPGEPLAGQITNLLRDLRLPPHVAQATDAALLEELGLRSGSRLLLQSFLELLRALKASGRSFSLCFRTFGSDLAKLAGEFNALCENRHPLFVDGEDVVLDGSDGAPDMRLKLDAGSRTCGTWVRRGNDISLVFGTIEQPPLEKASSDVLSEFYAAQASEDGQPAKVQIVPGSPAARDQLREILHQPGAGCTLALRDYYDGWHETGCKAAGGKPLFLETRDTSILQIFFDDHVLPNDAHIIDARLAEEPCQSVPIARVFGVHVVRAEPLCAIRDPRYFIDAVATAESQWRASCRRRRELAEAVARYGAESAFAAVNRGPDTLSRYGRSLYTPHSQCGVVRLRSDANALDDDDDLQVDAQSPNRKYPGNRAAAMLHRLSEDFCG